MHRGDGSYIINYYKGYSLIISIVFNYLLTEPFSCAYINRYGFRYCLFFGSILTVTWVALLRLYIENDELPFKHFDLVLAAVGGKPKKILLLLI